MWFPQTVSHNSSTLLTLLLGLNCIFIFLLVLIARRLYYLQTKWKSLFAKAEGKRIETLLSDHLRDQMKIEDDIQGIKERLFLVEGIGAASKRHTGLVKYDAFPDIGGNQSFALAVLDDEGNGFLISSLAGRSDCRVYCKPVKDRKCEIGLSGEEDQALQMAISQHSSTRYPSNRVRK